MRVPPAVRGRPRHRRHPRHAAAPPIRGACPSAGGCALEALGLGRSSACCAYDGPTAPLAEQLELLAAAQAAVETHFSYPGETTEFVRQAAPILIRLIAAMGYAPRGPSVKAVHAVLLRLVHAERTGGTDLAVYRAMGVPPQSFARWKNLLGKLRDSAPAPGAHAGLEEAAHSTASAPEAGAPEAGEPADDALRAAGVLIQFAEAPHDAPSAPPSPPHSSSGGSPGDSYRASPASGDEGNAGTPQRSPPSPAAGCLMHLCGGAPLFARPDDVHEALARQTLVFRCRRTAADAFACLSCGARFQSLALERYYQGEAPPPRALRAGFDAPPDAACGELATLVTSTSLGVHNISMDGRPIAQGRDALVADGLAVSCELAPEHGGWGLRYDASARPLAAGAVVAIYPKHAGMLTSAQHNALPAMVAGAPKGEYALELRRRTLYATRGRRGAGAVNEHAWPNVEFAVVDIDLDDGPLFTVLALVTTRGVDPGEFFHAHYGSSYAPVRVAKAYAVERLPGPPTAPLDLNQLELEAAMRRAFSADELPLLRDIGGVIDFDGTPGARADPNFYRGGPSPPPTPQLTPPALPAHQPPAQQPPAPLPQAAAPRRTALGGYILHNVDFDGAPGTRGDPDLDGSGPSSLPAPQPAPPARPARQPPTQQRPTQPAHAARLQRQQRLAQRRAPTDGGTLACPMCSILLPGLTVTARAGCRCGGGPCARCGVDSCACPWSGGAPLAPRPTRAEQNPVSWGYIDLPLRDPCAPTILIVGEFSGVMADACRRHFPRDVTLTVDYRLTEGNAGLHYCGEARDILWTRRWRLLIAHPSCRAAAASNKAGRDARVASGELFFGMAFAVLLYSAPADVAIVEQPASLLEKAYRPPDTRLQFLDYGVPYSKEWCLWHRGGDIKAPPPSTPGAAAAARAPHRTVHHDRDERERLRSRTPAAIAEALCSAIDLEAHRPHGQPLYHEEVNVLASGYRALTGCAPPPGYDDPLARARPHGGQSWQPRSAAGSSAHAVADGDLGTAAAPPAAAVIDRPDQFGRGDTGARDPTGGERERASRRLLLAPLTHAAHRARPPPRPTAPLRGSRATQRRGLCAFSGVDQSPTAAAGGRPDQIGRGATGAPPPAAATGDRPDHIGRGAAGALARAAGGQHQRASRR